MIKLSSNIRFSPNISRGSVLFRKKLTEELNTKVFQSMLKLYEKKNDCGIEVVKSRYNSVLPERKNVQIVPLPLGDCDSYGGGVCIEESREDFLSGYSIEVPTNKKKKLNVSLLSAFMHESTHILDYLLNPKYVANYRQMCEKKIYDKEYFKIYERYFYNTDDMMHNDKEKMLMLAEEETRKALRRVQFDKKIVFLNYMKYSMEMEYHAYNQDILYAKLLQKLGKPIDSECLGDYNKYLAFPEKIEIINKLIREAIELQRVK